MKSLRALINKNNIKNTLPIVSFFVWPTMNDYAWLNGHPHWIEITLHDTNGNQAGRCYIYNKKQLLKDVEELVEPNTRIFVANISQDDLIYDLEKYKVPVGKSSTEVLSNENWIKSYTINEFKKLYK